MLSWTYGMYTTIKGIVALIVYVMFVIFLKFRLWPNLA